MKIKNIIILGALICSSSAVLASSAPVITTQPKSQTVNEGSSVTFSVVAESGGEEYQEGENFTTPISDTVKLDMVWINPGTFMMGSPEDELGRYDNETQHRVTLTKGYWLDKYEVTQAQYQAIMGTNPSDFKGDNLPVEQVTWHNATNFCFRLTEIERVAGRLPVGYEYTLPTEAQWEYACRAGTTTALNSGKNLSDIELCPEMDEVGWYQYNSDRKTHPVGQKLPNAWGLYDMHGNVYEWCLDWHGDYPTTSVTDPTGPTTSGGRVDRGGGWNYGACLSRSAQRGSGDPNGYHYGRGFRVALVPVKVQASAAADTLTYQWYKDGKTISGATASSYTLRSVKTTDAGKYTVKVSNNAGSVTSDAATLTVNPVLSSITINGSSSVNVGSTATYTCTASYSDGTSKTVKPTWAISSGTSYASITSAGVLTGKAAGTATIQAKYTDGSATKTVTKNVTVNAVKPTITTQPKSQTVNEGSSVTFSVTATGTAPLSYQWKKGGSSINGATGASYTISSVKAVDAGSYTVTVSNDAGSVTSSVATLNVTAAKPTITTQPKNQTVNEGSSVTFSVVATGTGLTYQWYKNSTNISGATSASYTIGSVKPGDAGSYTVTVSNSAGSVISSEATLTVTAKPTITTQPKSQTVNEGSSVTFSVVATGTGLKYQWKKGGSNISGATSSSYTISSAKTSDAGSYTVTVSNSAGSVTTSAATLTVTAKPTITTQPKSQTVNEGSSLTFSVVATGTGLSYQWKKGGSNISGATSSSYTISSAKTSDAGSYTVTVSNSAGSVTSSAATLTVTAKPTITTQPKSQTVNEGDPVTFSVTATGTGLKYQWKKGGSNISGATSSSYTISSAKTGDAGSYTVTVSNNAGSVTSSAASLTVKSIAKITVERSFPVGYIPGKTADVTLTVSGTVKLASLSFTETLPSGWTFNSMVEDGGMDIKPAEGTSGTLNFLWFISEPPALPFSVTYRVNVPKGADGNYPWSGTFIWVDSQGMPAEETIGGETSIWKGKLYHSGDYSPENWKFDMIEMVRLSQLYRAGSYHVDSTSADGYAPGSGSQNGEPHSGDYSPVNWKFDMIEMVRLSQLYRAGGYHLDSSTADGYAPGVEAAAAAASESAVEINARRTIGEVGDTVDISITITGEGTLASLSLKEILPEGWSFNSMVEDGGMDIKPEAGATGNLEFLWFMSEVPELPFTVTYRVNAPKKEGTYEWDGEIIWAGLSEEPEQRMIEGENSVTVTNTEGESPELSFILEDDGNTLILNFTGTLYESEDTVNWTEVKGAESPFKVDISEGKKFYRCAQ